MSVIAELKNVSFHYDEDGPKILDSVSLSLEEGSFSILVGPGGCGKSTLCHLFNGRIPHLIHGSLDGEIIVSGRSTSEVEMKDLSCAVGSVFQDPETMFATLTVEDEIAFGPENLLFDEDDIRESVDSLLDLTGIEAYRSNLVWNLSGGQIQKLGLAAVLAMKPRLVILDEPTANLDPVATRQVHELIIKLRSEGITILLVSRELDDFLAKADNLMVLDKGRLVASGEPYGLLLEHGTRISELGIWLPETVEIGLALINAGLDVSRIPITVDETLDVLKRLNLAPHGCCLEGFENERRFGAGEALIQGKDIKYSYGGGMYALQGVSLEIHPGEMLAIVGEKRCRKKHLGKDAHRSEQMQRRSSPAVRQEIGTMESP
jgi:energy-coupling factor transporter ATP-binding protein EcfA2